MKRIFRLMMISMILISFFGCKKEVKSSDQEKSDQENLLYSSGTLMPGEIFCDEDYCYWIDPELWDEPIITQDIIPGPADKLGYTITWEIIDPETGQKKIMSGIACPTAGENCGKLFYEFSNGTQIEVGLYLL